MGSLPYNLRVNVNVPFPSLVAGAAGIRISKSNGIWTIATDFSALAAQTPPAGQYNVSYLQVWNSQTGVYSLVSMGTLIAIGGGGGGGGGGGAIVPTTVTSAGTYNPLSTDTYLLINRITPAAGSVRLPLASSRAGVPMVIKDMAGDGLAHNTTVLFTGGETCDGQASIVINTNYGGFKFAPLPAGNWTVSP